MIKRGLGAYPASIDRSFKEFRIVKYIPHGEQYKILLGEVLFRNTDVVGFEPLEIRPPVVSDLDNLDRESDIYDYLFSETRDGFILYMKILKEALDKPMIVIRED